MANQEIMNPVTGEIVDSEETVSLVQHLTKAEIDQQIATAHRFPRSRTAVAKGCTELATFSPDAAAECNYALPRGGKKLTGPSIRFAEIVVAEYGNCRVGARVVHVDRFEKYIEAEAVFHDLEKNTATTARVRRRIVDSKGHVYNDDMIIVTGNAACSIAKRNAILAGVPKALWMPAYESALKVIKGDAKTLTERREGALKALAAFGVTPDLICAALEIDGVLEISIDHMPTMLAWYNALKDETETVETLFPPAAKEGADKQVKGTAAKLDKIAKEGAGNAQDGGSAEKAQDKPAEENAAHEGPQAQEQASAENGDEAKAHADGFAAQRKGIARRALPGPYRENEALGKAWLAGYDEAAAGGE